MQRKNHDTFFQYKHVAVPRDAMRSILSLMPTKDMASIQRVSKSFNLFASDSALWMHYLQRDFGLTISSDECNPKHYYRSIKDELAKEKNVIVNFYVYRTLICLANTLERQHYPDLALLFTKKQLGNLRKKPAYSKLMTFRNQPYIESLFEEESYTSIQTILNDLIPFIDQTVINRIKSFISTYYDAFIFNQAPLIKSINELPILYQTSFLDILHNANCNLSLEVGLHVHPEAIDLLAKKMLKAWDTLFENISGYFSKEISEQDDLYNDLRRTVQFINWMLDHHFDIDKKLTLEVLPFGERDYLTTRIAAETLTSGVVLANYIVDKLKNGTEHHRLMDMCNQLDSNMHDPHGNALTTTQINFINKLFDQAGLPEKYPTIQSLTRAQRVELVFKSIQLGFVLEKTNQKLQEDRYDTLYKDLMSLMKRIINIPLCTRVPALNLNHL